MQCVLQRASFEIGYWEKRATYFFQSTTFWLALVNLEILSPTGDGIGQRKSPWTCLRKVFAAGLFCELSHTDLVSLLLFIATKLLKEAPYMTAKTSFRYMPSLNGDNQFTLQIDKNHPEN
jgi:hypothetical protein